MSLNSRTLFSCVVSLLLCGSSWGGGLLIPESTDDRILLLAENGTVINPNFLDIATPAAAAGVSATPIEALDVGEEIWVSDQVADRIWRFSQTGAFLGDLLADEVDNIRGMEVVGDTLYVAQGGSVSWPVGVLTVDIPTQTITGSFARSIPDDTSYYDVFAFGDELLVTNSDSGNDAIERFSLDGTFLGFLAQSDGVADFDFLQQLSVRANGNLIGGGFSVPSGVFEFQPDGTSLGIVAGLDRGPRGVWELPNGEILWTNGSTAQTDSTIFADGGGYRFISPTVVPEPAIASWLLLALLTLLGWNQRHHRLS